MDQQHNIVLTDLKFKTNQLKEIIQYFRFEKDFKSFSFINKKCAQVLLLFEDNPIPFNKHLKLLFPNVSIQNIFDYEEHVFGMKKYVYYCEVSYSYYHEMHGGRMEFKHITFNANDRIKYSGQLPNGITNIGFKSFYRSNIQVAIIPNSVTSISNNAFEQSNQLKTVYFSKQLLSIGAEAFLDCVSLKEINIPTMVQFIGNDCFKGCISLKEDPIKKINEIKQKK